MKTLDIAVAEGFLERYLEMDVEEGKPGSDKAFEHLHTLLDAIDGYEREMMLVSAKLDQILFQLRSR
jgi:hypothetical protein